MPKLIAAVLHGCQGSTATVGPKVLWSGVAQQGFRPGLGCKLRNRPELGQARNRKGTRPGCIGRIGLSRQQVVTCIFRLFYIAAQAAPGQRWLRILGERML